MSSQVVSDKGALGFSRDGSRLFVPMAPPAIGPTGSFAEPRLELWMSAEGRQRQFEPITSGHTVSP